MCRSNHPLTVVWVSVVWVCGLSGDGLELLLSVTALQLQMTDLLLQVLQRGKNGCKNTAVQGDLHLDVIYSAHTGPMHTITNQNSIHMKRSANQKRAHLHTEVLKRLNGSESKLSSRWRCSPNIQKWVLWIFHHKTSDPEQKFGSKCVCTSKTLL